MRGSKNDLFAAPRADVSRRRHTGAVLTMSRTFWAMTLHGA